MADTIIQEYQSEKWGEEASLSLSVVSREGDTVLLEAQLFDKNNIRCLDSKKYVEFEIIGNGSLIQNQGTSTGSRKLQTYNGRARIKVNLKKRRILSLSSRVDCLPHSLKSNNSLYFCYNPSFFRIKTVANILRRRIIVENKRENV